MVLKESWLGRSAMTSSLDFQGKCKIKLFLKPVLAVMEETPEGELPALPGLGALEVSSEKYQIRIGMIY